MRGLLLVLVVFLVNLPAVYGGWTDHQLASRGRDVEGVVIHARQIGDRYLVDYRLPAEFDRARTTFSASVDEPTYETARRTDRLAVRVLPGRPGANRPDGLVPSSLFTVIAITADLVLVLIAVLAWYRRRHPGDMPDPRPRPVGL